MAGYKEYGYQTTQSTHSHSYILNNVLETIEKNKERIVLDLGCGNGALVKILIAKGYQAYGTDASVQGIKIAKESYPNNFELQDLSIDDLPTNFRELKFDTIVSTEVIEHLYDPRKYIKLCKSILLKNGGGEIILTTPYHGYLKNIFLSFANKWDKHANPLWDGGHIKLWSKHTIVTLLNEFNFELVEFKGCGRFPYFWKSMMIRAKVTTK
jgi:2-polyprenyl-3-methyl-5-hydroxy-6-metoxy-1,4-benzoquinol methylase